MIGDAFRLWTLRAEQRRSRYMNLTVQELKATCEAQHDRITALESEMVKYQKLKLDYVCHKILGRWFELWQSFAREAFSTWKFRTAESQEEERSKQTMKRYIIRNMRHLEHKALRKWILFARERTEKIKGCCSTMLHSLIRMRNFSLHRAFRKWLEVGRSQEIQKAHAMAERKLVVTKASQALMMLERGVSNARNELGGDDGDDDYGDY